MGEPKYKADNTPSQASRQSPQQGAEHAGDEHPEPTDAQSAIEAHVQPEGTEFSELAPDDEPSLLDRRSRGTGHRDRRVITRLHAPELRNSVRSIQSICHVWVWASVLYVLTTVGHQVYTDFNNTPKSIFFGVVILTLSFAAFRISRAAKSYLENESQARLEKLVECFKFLTFTAATASLIIGSAYLLTLF